MVAKVTHYLQEVLAPTLDHFRVPATYASQIIDTVELQMILFLRHWDDLAFRRTLLLLGSEEGPFYEPAGKADVKCFIVVTLRNSPIKTIQSDNYACAGMQNSLSSQDVKEITSGAIRFFNPLDFPPCAYRRRTVRDMITIKKSRNAILPRGRLCGH